MYYSPTAELWQHTKNFWAAVFQTALACYQWIVKLVKD